MSNEAGVRMCLAMEAVVHLHQDCIKLINDIDKHMQGYQSYYDNTVTQGLGSAISNRRYLADGLMRFYYRTNDLSKMLGVNVCFFDLDDPKFIEPIFVVANLTYERADVDYAEKYRRAWDPWYSFLNWAPERVYGQPISLTAPKGRENITTVTLAAIPLYDVKTAAAAIALVDMVGKPD